MQPKSIAFLETMARTAQGHYDRVIELLKALPAGLEEQTKLLDQEVQLRHLIDQLKQQIGVRKQ